MISTNMVYLRNGQLLKMSTEDAWRYHSTGATALIKLRGPGRCETDFEKALVLSHVGQIVSLSIEFVIFWKTLRNM